LAEHYEQIIGKEANKDLASDVLLSWKDVS